MLIFRGGAVARHDLSPSELQAHVEKWYRWSDQLARQGRGNAGTALGNPGAAVRGHERVVTDGPYAESKDLVTGSNLLERAADVDGIPVVWIQPGNQDGDARIVLWLPWLTGTKEDAIPFLAELAGRGFTAVSFDLWQHGQRGTETGEQIAARVFGGFRRHMWPILGQTTLDALRVGVAAFGAP